MRVMMPFLFCIAIWFGMDAMFGTNTTITIGMIMGYLACLLVHGNELKWS